tara:strand:- start:174 stop:611 length:438 start_codon:yes stop_codon:yes gene_type:complete
MKKILFIFTILSFFISFQSNGQANKYRSVNINEYVGDGVDAAMEERRQKRAASAERRSRNKETSYSYYRTGMSYLNNNQYSKALEYFNEACNYYCDPMVTYAAGVAVFKNGDKKSGCGYIYEAANKGIKIGDSWMDNCYIYWTNN